MGLERIFGDFDARPLTYLMHFKLTFDVDISTPFELIVYTSVVQHAARDRF